MPNWCSNHVRITGPDATLDKLVEHVKGEETQFDLNKIIPITKNQLLQMEEINWLGTRATKWKDRGIPESEWPIELQGGVLRNQFMNGSTNDLHVKVWGCKWNVEAEECSRCPGTVIYIFDSPWSPPMHAFFALIEAYPDLKFNIHYIEEGADYQGELVGESGLYQDYEKTPPELCGNCGCVKEKQDLDFWHDEVCSCPPDKRDWGEEDEEE